MSDKATELPASFRRASYTVSQEREVPCDSLPPNTVRPLCRFEVPREWDYLGGATIDIPSSRPHRFAVPVAWRDVPGVMFDR